MPEGDAVHRMALSMQRLVGRRARGSAFAVGSAAHVDDQVLLAVRARGKHLLHEFDGGVTVHSAVRLHGRWQARRVPRGLRDPRGVRRLVGIDVRAAIWLQRDEGSPPARGVRHGRIDIPPAPDPALLVAERMPVLELLASDRADATLAHLGPDLLGDDWDLDEAVRRLREGPGVALKVALLDQRNLAGIGNVWADEACWLAERSPWARVDEVADLDRVVATVHDWLRRAYATGVMSSTGRLQPGSQHRVVGREGQPCHRCGTPVSFVRAGTDWRHRRTWWCEGCQVGPGPPPTQHQSR